MRKDPHKDRFRKRINGRWCVYCGELATTDEHFPPKTFTHHGLILPACSECNVLAGASWATDFEERCRYVKDRLRQKYKRVLDTPDWSKSEVGALGRALKRRVKAWQELKEL